MYTRFSNSNEVVILLHEIYGINKHMIDTADLIEELGIDVIIPNLLNHEKVYNYDEEHEAYQNFKMNVGFEKSTAKVKKLISEYSEKYGKMSLVGYSVGATIAWLCSESHLCDRVVCYYGSRIRENLNIKPQIPTLLFLPEKEKSFLVDDLYNKLTQKQSEHNEVHTYKANHGFADPYSKYYNKEAYKRSFHQMVNFLRV
ncbi:dienelactone hydrolase family protein [Chengkuizengella sediminis]|uniref:dienelactone hydrolase family protein n=1 Tax=Chengkuizengella sediminis TaxID=1885917 RepID=UPI00138A32B2|nr:dienelactone hydrolase family protein [Chengkuizengella sediminis]NDI34107.1 dienelactone hydrolase family protein [Chengkuizengella sediminis]